MWQGERDQSQQGIGGLASCGHMTAAGHLLRQPMQHQRRLRLVIRSGNQGTLGQAESAQGRHCLVPLHRVTRRIGQWLGQCVDLADEQAFRNRVRCAEGEQAQQLRGRPVEARKRDR